jgi:hypothetical protein
LNEPDPAPPAPPSRRGSRAALAALALVCVIFVARGLAYLDFVPLWDGRQYADCVTEAATQGLTLTRLNCFAHPSAAYIAVLAAATKLDPGSFVPMLLANLALGVVALVFFYLLARFTFPHEDQRWECVLATAALSLHPVLLASALNVNADYGVLVYLLPTLYCVARGRFVAATFWGLALSFSKEPGVVFLAALGASWVLVALPGRRSWAERWRAARPALWFFAAPALLAVWMLLKPHAANTTTGIWGGLKPSDLLLMVFSLDANSAVVSNYLIGIFVLGFQWILALGAAAALLGALARRRGLGERLATSTTSRTLAVATLTLVVSTYVLLRFPTFINVRYVLPLAPLLVLLAIAGFARIERRGLRLAVWTTVCALFALSSYTTFDPLAKRLFGTFPLGLHPLLAMTSRSGECCGKGRDQLVYNLEFTHFHTLQDAFYADVKAGADTAISGPPLSDWFFFGPLDAATHARTLRTGAGTVHPPFVDGRALRSGMAPPAKLYYLMLPNLPYADPLIDRLYSIAGARRYEEHGYRLDVLELRLKAAPAGGPGRDPRNPAW